MIDWRDHGPTDTDGVGHASRLSYISQFSPGRGSPYRPVFRGDAGSSVELPPAELPTSPLKPKAASARSALMDIN
jgi:hypothetical protein